jgi:DedD protein
MARYFDEDELEVEEPRRDAEVTLSWVALAGMGLGLLAICALCFGLGYMAGHRGATSGGAGSAVATPSSSPPNAADQEPLQGSGSVPKPSASAQAAVSPVNRNLTQTLANGGESPEATAPSSGPSAQGSSTLGATASAPPSQTQVRPALGSNAPETAQASSGPNVRPALPSATTLMVQVAAVRNAEDASVLTNALRKRGYPVSEQREAGDGLIHVRVGPFASQAEANQWRMKLLDDGYNAIVQP